MTRTYHNIFVCRLPHSWEWQWIAQGSDERPWPWGFEEPDETKIPKFTSGRVMPPPDDTDAHPEVSNFHLSFIHILSKFVLK